MTVPTDSQIFDDHFAALSDEQKTTFTFLFGIALPDGFFSRMDREGQEQVLASLYDLVESGKLDEFSANQVTAICDKACGQYEIDDADLAKATRINTPLHVSAKALIEGAKSIVHIPVSNKTMH